LEDPFFPQDSKKYDEFDAYRLKIIQGIIDVYYLGDGLRLPGARSKPKHKKYKKRDAEEPMYQNQSLKPQIICEKINLFPRKKLTGFLEWMSHQDEEKINTRQLLV
jgi:hypothetical protein